MKDGGHALACKQGNMADGEISENVSATKVSRQSPYCSLPAMRGHLLQLLPDRHI